MIFRNVKRSAAYHGLTVYGRAALLELIDRYDGCNNGMIGLGVRELAYELRCSRGAASIALRELDDAGLARPVTMGARRSSSQAPRATTLVVDGAEHEFAVSEIGAGCFRLGGGHGPERTMQAPSKLGLPVGGAITLDVALKVLIGPTPVLQ